MSDRKFNFEFDPNVVYTPTSVLRRDSRPGGYDNVQCPDCPERDAAVAATTERIEKELENEKEFLSRAI
jgi:hypothetical protein